MKKIFSLTLFAIICFCSCVPDTENENEFEQRPNNDLVALNLPFYTSDYDSEDLIEVNDNFTLDGENFGIQIEFDDRSEKLVKISISESYLSFTGFTLNEIEEQFVTNFDPGGDDPKDDLSEHAKCIEACNRLYTDEDGEKMKGRGRCKGNCWVDTAIRLVDAITPF